MGGLILVLCGQVDRRRDWPSLRCTPQYDLPSQRDTSEPPRSHWCTREACDVRHVRISAGILYSILGGASLNLTSSENRATGVSFSLNPLLNPDGPTETRIVRGTKLVVISAGSLGTPGILERSGIGGKEILEGVGVKQLVDLPGVGENYHGAPRNTLAVIRPII